MTKPYCGVRKPRKNQHSGTAKECADISQVRQYGLDKISPNLLKKLKPRVRKAMKAKHPIEKEVKPFIPFPGLAEQAKKLREKIHRGGPKKEAKKKFSIPKKLLDENPGLAEEFENVKKQVNKIAKDIENRKYEGPRLERGPYVPESYEVIEHIADELRHDIEKPIKYDANPGPYAAELKKLKEGQLKQTIKEQVEEILQPIIKLQKLNKARKGKPESDIMSTGERWFPSIEQKLPSGEPGPYADQVKRLREGKIDECFNFAPDIKAQCKYWKDSGLLDLLNKADRNEFFEHLRYWQKSENSFGKVKNVSQEGLQARGHEQFQRLDKLDKLYDKFYKRYVSPEKPRGAAFNIMNPEPIIFKPYPIKNGNNKYYSPPFHSEGGKFIEQDMRRQMNAIQVKDLYGGGCMNCGGDFDQALSDATDSKGGDFFFDQTYEPDIEFQKLTAVKPDSSISNPIKKIIELISGKSKSVIPFGSWKYKSQLYPGDIDLIEIDEECCSKEEATIKFVKHIQKIVRAIKNARGVYLGDIKAGEDKLFKVDIGQMIFDNNGFVRIDNYNPVKIRAFVNEWSKLKLITPEQKKEILSHVLDKTNQLHFEQLYATLRELWLLRWTEKEILKGQKKLPGKRKYTLAQAINDPTITKIDLWTQISGRYMEFSNLLVFYMIDKDGNRKVLNFNDADIVEALKFQVQKFAFSKNDLKLLKMVKRIWSIARLTNDKKMIEKLTPLLQTDLGRISQISSEMDTVILMLQNLKIPPMSSIMKQIDGWKYRFSNIYQLDINEEEIDKIFDKLLKHNKNTKANKEYIIKVLKELKSQFLKISNDVLMKILKYIGVVPIPPNYLPPTGKGKGLYTSAANIYRKNFCKGKARPLLDNPTEYHPGCFNFCG